MSYPRAAAQTATRIAALPMLVATGVPFVLLHNKLPDTVRQGEGEPGGGEA